MKTFQVEFQYLDRNDATQGSTLIIDASSLPGAVAKAARQYVKGLDRKQRFDLNKNGLTIKATLADSEKESAHAAAGSAAS